MTPMYVPLRSLLDDMPDDGTAVVIGDETGYGSLWIDWEHHGDISVTSDELAAGLVWVP